MALRTLEVRPQVARRRARALFPSLSVLQYQHAVMARREAVRRYLAHQILPSPV